MSISIYTYSNPYELNQEKFFSYLQKSPHLCASQTLVNGIRALYSQKSNTNSKDYIDPDYISTFNFFLDKLYSDWNSPSWKIKQHAAIDNIVHQEQIVSSDLSNREDRVRAAFLNNRNDTLESIRSLYELGVKIEEINTSKLSEEQKILINIYKYTKCEPYCAQFDFPYNFSRQEIDQAIVESLKYRNRAGIIKEIDTDHLDLSTVVIHGVHQFTPLMLQAIDQLAKVKNLILLFNYQHQYSEVYQTWINIYKGFNLPIQSAPRNELRPSPNNETSYEGNLLADQLGQLIEGNTQNVTQMPNVEIEEFNNVTEFANYVDQCYSYAADYKEEHDNGRNLDVLAYMKEQFYSTDMRVNNILKIYYPEQFGERQFLNYPIGHFVLAITNMWDPDTQTVHVEELDDLRECLSAGVVDEDRFGDLLSLFETASPILEGCHSIPEMISALKAVANNYHKATQDEIVEISRIAYYSLSEVQLNQLIGALDAIESDAELFYKDFDSHPENFKAFYINLEKFLKGKILTRDLDDEFRGILKRVLIQLDEMKNTPAHASFQCLRDTMSIYLKQQPAPGTSAHWIVRGFNQIDGDILQSSRQGAGTTYHFACLSDDDMNHVREDFPWPLDYDFFEKAQDPIDKKFQIYMTSVREKRNFNRYALIYGLQFNKSKYKLSFIRNDGERKKDYLYLLRLLGVKKLVYADKRHDDYAPYARGIELNKGFDSKYSADDMYRYRVCKYRFLLESIIENNTVYKDDYLLQKYFIILLSNHVRLQIQSNPHGHIGLNNKLSQEYDHLKHYFPFTGTVDKDMIIKSAEEYIGKNSRKKGNRYSRISDEQLREMKLQEIFIPSTTDKGSYTTYGIFDEPTQEDISTLLSEDTLHNEYFPDHPEKTDWCKTCANREICLYSYLYQ